MSLRRTLQFALAVLVASVALGLGTTAGAVPNPDYTAPPPAQQVRNPSPPARQVASAAPASASTSREMMPITGSDTAQLALIGGVLLAVGAGTMVLRRRSLA